MRAIRQKLHSQRGASILMSLLFFLLVTVVGAVILASATANVDKTLRRREAQQDYLAISSAARLLRETVCTTQCQGWDRKVIHTCLGSSAADPPPHPDSTEVCPSMRAPDSDAQLQAYLSDLAYQMYRSQTPYSPRLAPPSMPVTFTVEAEGGKTVSITLTMDSSYGMVMELTLPPPSPYALTLTFPATVTAPDAPAVEEVAAWCTHTHTEKRVNEDGTEEDVLVSVAYDQISYTRESAVQWEREQCSVTKGVVGGV